MSEAKRATDSDTRTITAGKTDEGCRLDLFLAEALVETGFSRSRVKGLLSSGFISVNGAPAKPSYRLRADDEILVRRPPLVPAELIPEEVEFTILHEDEDLVVLSKPPGLVVHPACGHHSGTLVHGLLFHCDNLSGISGVERPGIVHRLDRDTSGAMVVAKNDKAHHGLVEQFKSREVEKIYRAIVDGIPERPRGRIAMPIGRHPSQRRKMAVNENQGKAAVSNYRVLETFPGNLSYIEVRLETGRTHQIRVHMAALGCPVAGDEVYGRKNRKLYEELGIGRQCLHSYSLGFTHPGSGERLSFTAPLWPDMADTLEILRG